MLFHRPLTQLAAPKIPEGERVDFDVCSFKVVVNRTSTRLLPQKQRFNNIDLGVHWSSTGYPQEEDGERPPGAADSD